MLLNPIMHVPAKCTHFADEDMLQNLNLERFLIAEAIPLHRKALLQRRYHDRART
jgi:hypothetical protein